MIRVTLFSMLIAASVAGAQTTDTVPKPPMRSSMVGVYSEEQATRGTDTYAGICASCHTIPELTGANFSKKWVGFPLWDLYKYLATEMPQSDPGSLTPKEYAQVVAYLLKLNGQPAGKEELPADTAALKAIKVDTVKVDTLRSRLPLAARR